MRRLSRLVLLVVPTTAWAISAFATQRTVQPDGAGAYPSIQAAVNASATGDSIALTNGTFVGPGNRDVNITGKGIVIRSVSGDLLNCTIDAQGSSTSLRRVFYIHDANSMTTRIEGIRIRGGYEPNGTPGALFGHITNIVVRNCIFMANTGGIGGAICVDNCPIAVENSTFDGNHSLGGFADDTGAAICLSVSTVSITNCTLISNSCDNNPQGGIISCIHPGSTTTITNCIIAFNPNGHAVHQSESPSVTADCTDVFGNPDGNYVDAISGQTNLRGNISSDPLFCSEDPYRVSVGSPCAPEHNPSGCLMGAWPIGCTLPGVAVSGTVSFGTSPGGGMYPVAIRLTPGPHDVATDGCGHYTISSVPLGTYTAAPIAGPHFDPDDWMWVPQTQLVVVNTEPVTGVDFSAVARGNPVVSLVGEIPASVAVGQEFSLTFQLENFSSQSHLIEAYLDVSFPNEASVSLTEIEATAPPGASWTTGPTLISAGADIWHAPNEEHCFYPVPAQYSLVTASRT